MPPIVKYPFYVGTINNNNILNTYNTNYND